MGCDEIYEVWIGELFYSDFNCIAFNGDNFIGNSAIKIFELRDTYCFIVVAENKTCI